MCGIAGIVCSPELELPRDWPAVPLRTLSHRGPDDQGWLAFTPEKTRLGRGDMAPDGATRAVLLHRRLSILDQSAAGWQPMTTADGQVHIVFNGEIYNYLELRQELAREGCTFRSQSDTEVLLQALRCWGPSALRRLVGMFALAVLDRQQRILFLARDFFGIKPLYYVQTAQTFAFASEIKVLLELPGVRRAVDPQRLYEYLLFGRTDHGGNTLLSDVRQLPAGCFLEVPLDRPAAGQPSRYWTLDLSDRLDLSFDEAARRLRELFLESVRLHLRSDVAVGAALSGGIDSSAIVAAMRLAAPRADLHVFSYVADDPVLGEPLSTRSTPRRAK
jgi:asparagine synthase (glutamine-hydrolysing)